MVFVVNSFLYLVIKYLDCCFVVIHFVMIVLLDYPFRYILLFLHLKKFLNPRAVWVVGYFSTTSNEA